MLQRIVVVRETENMAVSLQMYKALHLIYHDKHDSHTGNWAGGKIQVLVLDNKVSLDASTDAKGSAVHVLYNVFVKMLYLCFLIFGALGLSAWRTTMDWSTLWNSVAKQQLKDLLRSV